MKGKTKTILAIVLAVAIVSVAAVGTVTFLKDNGRAAAADTEEATTLPNAGTQETTNPGTTTNPGNPNEGATTEPVDAEDAATPAADVGGATPAAAGGPVAGTVNPTPATPAETTIEQERLASTTLNWSNIELNGDVAGRSVNYTTLKYTVNYIVIGAEGFNETETGKGEIGTEVEVSDEDIDDHCPTGFKPVEDNETSVVITENEDDNVINIYYEKDEDQTQDTDYTVKHVVAGVEQTDDTKTYNSTAWINDDPAMIKIETGSLAENTYTGYKLDSITPDVAEGDEVESGTTIILTYVKDEDWTQDTDYTVKHVVAGVEQTDDTKTYNSTAWINDDPAMIEIQAGSLAENTYVGYKLDSITPTVSEGDKVESGTTITLSYVKDEDWTKDTYYIVQHVVVGEATPRDTYTYTGKAWINDDPAMIEIQAGSLSPKTTYVGYRYDSTDTTHTIGDKIESGTVITFFYVKDENQIQYTRYKVEHIIEGETTPRDSKEYYGTAWVNDNPAMIEIEAGSLAPKTYTGYKLGSITPNVAEGDEVESKTTITLKYVKDDDWTQDTKYTVKHIVEGETTPRDSEEFTSTAWINDDPAMIKIQTGSLAEKDYTGYKFGSIDTDKTEGDEVETGTVITLTYVKDETDTKVTKYTVNHVVSGETTPRDSEEFTSTAWVNDDPAMIEIQAGSLDHKTYTGYKFGSIDTDKVVGDEVETGTVITLTYVKDDAWTQDTVYTVEHKIGNEVKDSQDYTSTAWVNDDPAMIEIQAGSLDHKTYTGYKFGSIDTDKVVGDEVETGTVITLTYVKDEDWTQDTKYTVKHVVSGETTPRDSEDYTSTAWVNDDPAMIEIQAGSLDHKTYTGYKFSSIDTDKTVGDEVVSGTVITLTYIKDDAWTQDTVYTVKHVVSGETTPRDSEDYTSTAWINDDPAMITIVAGSLDHKTYTGYKFSSIDTDKTVGDEVVSGTVITLTYVKDDAWTQDTVYTVKHVVSGETTPRDSQEYTSTAWINDDPAMITIVANSLDHKTYTGYKFDSIDTDKVVGDEVETGTVITLTYVKDETATKEMSYTVEYYKDGVKVDGDTDTVTKDVWVNDTTMPVDVDDINVTDKYTGYHFVETDPAQIPTEIEANGVIKVYYEISSYSYKVQHYYEVEVDEINPDGYKLDASLTDNISNIEYGTQVSTFTKKEIDGYEYERASGVPLTISDVEENNVIRVYYKKKQIDYKVEYYFEKVDEEGYEIDNSLTDTITTAKFGDKISDYTDKVKTGFEFKEVKTTNSATGDEKLPLVISANANNNIIRVYYDRLSYSYSIEYYYEKDDSNDYDQDETLTVTGTAKYGSEISEYTPQEKTGFTFERTENNPLIITEKSDENVMKVFYGKPKVRVKSIGARDAHVGEIITYTIILENVGRVPGTIDVKNQLSDLVTYVDSSIEPEIADGLLTWKNITVEPGEAGEVTITIDVRINDNAIGLEIVDTVIVPDQEDTIHTSNVFEIDSTIHEIKQGETGKDSVNVVLVMDLSTSMNSKIRTFTECTHEHVFETHTHGHSGHTWTEETCPEGCIKTSSGKWGKYENTDQTRLQAARAAAQGFINNLYTNNPNSNATVTVITFNGSATILTFNGKTTATHNDYSELVTAVGNLATSTMGTNIRAALDKTYTKICGTNGLTTLYPDNSNVVIFLGDGEPSSGYSNNNSTGINARARDIDGTTGAGAGATIYAIGFGEEATDPDGNGYKILEVISSDGTVLTANDYTELAAAFTNIQEQIQDKSDQTDHGTLSFTASNTLVIDSNNPLRAILKNDDETETVLFVCTSIDDLDDYCITYNSSTRTLSWDLNEWNTGSVHTHVTSDNAFLSYYVAR